MVETQLMLRSALPSGELAFTAVHALPSYDSMRGSTMLSGSLRVPTAQQSLVSGQLTPDNWPIPGRVGPATVLQTLPS
jgi:hypothetical protein